MRTLIQRLEEAALRWPGTAALERAVARAVAALAPPPPEVRVLARGAQTHLVLRPGEGLPLPAWPAQRAALQEALRRGLPALPAGYQWRVEQNVMVGSLEATIESWLDAATRQTRMAP